MKTVLLAFLLIPFIISCTGELQPNSEKLDDTSDTDSSYPQKWQLVRMSGNMANSERTGEDMEWQEFYVLNTDNTFTKSRTSNEKTSKAVGTFTFLELSKERYLQLSYSSKVDIMGSCTSEAKELMLIVSDDSMVGTWQACDGPGLEYLKVE